MCVYDNTGLKMKGRVDEMENGSERHVRRPSYEYDTHKALYTLLALDTQTLTDLVEVEGEFPRDGAVEASLEVCGPVLCQDILATCVLLAHASHPGVHILATVDVLDSSLSKEEHHVLPDLVGTHEVWF